VGVDDGEELLGANSVVAHYEEVDLSPLQLALNLRLFAVLVNLSNQILGGKELVYFQSPVVGESGGADDEVAELAVLALVPSSEKNLPLSRLV